MKEIRLPVDAPAPRLDRWLSARLPEFSRTRAQGLIGDGHVLVNGHPAKAGRRLAAGDTVTAHIPDPTPPAGVAPEAIPLAVIFEDDDIIVVNKPAGLVVHPAAGHANGTLVNALLHHCRDLAGIGGEMRPGIVHRLDRDTSGLLVAAKNDAAMRGLVTQFKGRLLRKEYCALVWNAPRPASGRIETLIGRSARDRKKMSATPPRGRPAVTNYNTEQVLGPVSLLRLHIETGRTHQIRVHLAHIGCPVVGDAVYGRKRPVPLPAAVPRQMLHAARLVFRHPRTGAPLDLLAPVPEDMAALIRALSAFGSPVV